MTSEYNEIYSRFYLEVEDYDMAAMEEKLAKKKMNGWIKTTLSKPYVRRLFASIEIDDDLEEIEYEMKYPVSDDEDKDFVEEMIALGMVESWLNPKYHSALNTDQLLTNSEQKFYSQANHMSELKEMYRKAQNDLRKHIRDRGYINNTYLSE